MGESPNDIKKYTANDIQQYLSGTMNAADMHAIEKAALEDPMLADAIDGIREAGKEYGNNTIAANIEQLHKQIAAKARGGKPAPVISFNWWRIAVAASVLIVCSVWAYNTWFTPRSPEVIAVNDEKMNKPESINPATPENTIAKKDTSKEKTAKITDNENIISHFSETEKQQESKLPKPVIAKEKQEVTIAPPVAGRSEETKEIQNKNDIAKEDDRNRSHKTENETARSSEAEKKEAVPAPATADKSLVIVNDPAKRANSKAAGINNNFTLNYFNGKIIDNNNAPIANATVQLANTNNGYLTDQNGFFKFPSTDTLVDVNVSVVGFASQKFQLRNNIPINRLQLQPAATAGALSEVVVTTTDQEQRKRKTNFKTKFPSVLIQNAEPTIGWIEFEKYIAANKKTIVSQTPVTGEVVVSFQVNRNAALSAFTIEQSLGPAQDEEAIRLIKEGPTWHLLKGKRTRVMVIIRF